MYFPTWCSKQSHREGWSLCQHHLLPFWVRFLSLLGQCCFPLTCVWCCCLSFACGWCWSPSLSPHARWSSPGFCCETNDSWNRARVVLDIHGKDPVSKLETSTRRRLTSASFFPKIQNVWKPVQHGSLHELALRHHKLRHGTVVWNPSSFFLERWTMRCKLDELSVVFIDEHARTLFEDNNIYIRFERGLNQTQIVQFLGSQFQVQLVVLGFFGDVQAKDVQHVIGAVIQRSGGVGMKGESGDQQEQMNSDAGRDPSLMDSWSRLACDQTTLRKASCTCLAY